MVTVNKKQASVLALVAIFAAIMVVGPVATTDVFAHKKHHHHHHDNDNGGNRADQSISQEQSNEQNSLCVSGDDTDDSCNNFSAQFQFNSGNNALGQQDNDEED